MTMLMLSLEDVPLAISPDDRQRVIDNLQEFKDEVWHLKSENTKRAYQSDFKQYLSFCMDNGMPALASDWRITRESCRSYLKYMMASKLKHHTIRRKIASIRYFIGVSELADPWKHSKLFTEFTNNTLKAKPSRQGQAKPLRVNLIDKFTSQLDLDNLLELRDAVIFNVAIDTIFRASNLLAIDISHIKFSQNKVFAPRSKTDRTGKGHYGYISQTSIELIKRWMEAGNISTGPLFRTLSPKHTVRDEGMQYHALISRYRTIARRIMIEDRFSCHSTRVGGVVTMFENGVSLDEIQKAGGWSSQAMPLHYAEEYDVAKTGMARLR
ncbi:hypothetical protein AltI4_44580 (plasmid) [Alteromonas sp. I4]|nr:hypothetical protein AltI4_44580 [Alteromonas sp. I4]